MNLFRLSKRLKPKTVLKIALLIIVLAFAKTIFLNKAHFFESCYQYQRLSPTGASVGSIEKEFPDKYGGRAENIIDGEPSWWYGKVYNGHNNWVELNWDYSQDIDKIFIDFGGRLAVDFEIDVWNGKEWVNKESVRDNTKDSFLVYYFSPGEIYTDKLKITFNKTKPSDHLQQVSEVIVYRAEKNNLLQMVFAFFYIWPRSLFAYFFYAILFFLITFMCGNSILMFFEKHFRLDESLALSFVIGYFILFLKGIIILLAPDWLGKLLTILIFSCCTYVFFKYKRWKKLIGQKLPLALIALYGVFILGFYISKDMTPLEGMLRSDSYYDALPKYSVPFGLYEQDYLIPYGTAKALMYKLKADSVRVKALMGDYNISDRTPLLALSSIPFLKLFGDRFFIFEVVNIISVLPFLLSCFLLFKKVFTYRVSVIATFFLLTSHSILFMNHFMPVRYFMCFFIALFYYSLINLKAKSVGNAYLFLASISGIMAFLAHPSASLYIILGFFYYFITHLTDKDRNSHLLGIFGPIMSIILLWIFWGKLAGSSGLIVTKALTNRWLREPSNNNIASNLVSFISDFFYSFSDKFYNLLGMFITDPKPGITRTWGFFRLTIISAISLIIFPFTTFGIIKNFKSKQLETTVLLFGVIVTSILLYPASYSQWGNNQFIVGIIPVFITFGVSIISNLSTRLLKTIFLLHIFESIMINWVIYPHESTNNLVYQFKQGNWLPVGIVVFFLLWYLVVYKLFILNVIKKSMQKIDSNKARIDG